MIDILYLAHKRPKFTDASLRTLIANTDWSKARLVLYTDGDARPDLPAGSPPAVHFSCLSDRQHYGGPVAIMNEFLRTRRGSANFVKLDNDVMVPPGWLEACTAVMDAHPELGLLGIEPPASRTPNPQSRWPVPTPEDDCGSRFSGGYLAGYARCDSIGGIGLMRRSAFAGRAAMRPHSIYGGFSDWQLAHPEVVKGWIVPPLKVFLLDRLPISPWKELSAEYIAKGWQRPWTDYSLEASALWDWCDLKTLERTNA